MIFSPADHLQAYSLVVRVLIWLGSFWWGRERLSGFRRRIALFLRQYLLRHLCASPMTNYGLAVARNLPD